jgi:hypothetical protein
MTPNAPGTAAEPETLHKLYTRGAPQYGKMWCPKLHIMIFARRLANEGRTRKFTVELAAPAGWIAREDDGRAAPKTNLMREWRQVEAIMVAFDMKAAALRDQGWAED